VPVDKAVCDAWRKKIEVFGIICDVLGHFCDCTCKKKKKRWKWRCTIKPRGTCKPDCLIFAGGGATRDEAKRDVTEACFDSGCNTPGGQPFNCQCGHPTCFQLAN
jgi:hypothetical protein